MLKVWLPVAIVGGFILGQLFGQYYILSSLQNAGKYEAEDVTYLCVEKPTIGSNQGEYQYLRPTGK